MTNETVSMLEQKIAEEKKNQEELWLSLGCRMDQDHVDVVKTYAPDLWEKLEASRANITKYQEEIYAVQGLVACPNCHTYNASDSIFCIHCGSLLKSPQTEAGERVCPHCGAPVANDHLFCSRCGTRIDAQVEQPIEDLEMVEEVEIHEIFEPEEEVTAITQEWQTQNYDDMTTLLVDESTLVNEEVTRCPICGEPVDPEQTFCIHCGSRLDDQPVQIDIESTEPSLVCPNCGEKVNEDDVFCMNCGTRLENKAKPQIEEVSLVCPVCGASTKEGQVFCINCGAKLK